MHSLEQSAEMHRRFVVFLQAIEREKLLYFILADQQPNPVVLLEAPAGNKEQKKLLGYEWSTTKGNEGIKVTKDAQGHHVTLLYDETNRHNAGKISNAIARNFMGELNIIPAELGDYLSLVHLKDLLDFSRVTFEKQLGQSIKGGRAGIIWRKWPTKLGTICSFEYGKPLAARKRVQGPYPVMGSNGSVGSHDQYIVKGPAIIVGRKGSAGAVIWEPSDCFPIDTTFFVKLVREDTRLRFIYEQLRLLRLGDVGGGMGVPGLNRNDAYDAAMTLPPPGTQDLIIAECKAIDASVPNILQGGTSVNDLSDAIDQMKMAIFLKHCG